MGYTITPKKTSQARVQRCEKREKVYKAQVEHEHDLQAASALLSLSTSEDYAGCTLKDQGTQTHNDVSLTLQVMKRKIDSLEREIEMVREQKQQVLRNRDDLKQQLDASKYTYNNIKSSKKLQFYTGVTRDIFNILISAVEKCPATTLLSTEDCLLLTLMRLRLACPNKDLAMRFNVSLPVVKNVVFEMLERLRHVLSDLIFWPEQSVCQANLPQAFKPSFRKVISIIDCFEVFIDRPTNLTTRAQCWSNYKHAYTIKFLISITPLGTISFISEGWGGRTSDKHITCESGYLNNLQHGHEILADRGFTLTTECAAHGAVLHIPSFTKGKKQLSGKEVTQSRKISRLRIHVERVIASLRKFKVLTSKCPLTLVKQLDNIVFIIAALTNLQNSIIN